MKFFYLFIVFCFMFNTSFGQYIYVKGYGGGDRQFPSLIITQNYQNVQSVIDTNILKDKFTKELLLLENKVDYEHMISFVRNYKALDNDSCQPLFIITETSEQGNFEYNIKGKGILDFLNRLDECLKETDKYNQIKCGFRRYYNLILYRFK